MTVGTLFGTRAQRIALAVILLFALGTRVGWALHLDAKPAATTSNDTPGYLEPARSIVEDGKFQAEPGSDEPLFLRTPGYPLFIAGVLTVDDDLTTLLVFQAALSCLIVLVGFLLASRLWSPTVGLAAALLIAFEPLQFAASGTLLTESLFSLLLLLTAALGFRVLRHGPPSVLWCAALGFAVATCTLVQPSTFYLPAFVMVLFVVVFRRFGWRPTTAAFVAFVAPVALLVGGWMVRNNAEAGTWRYSGIEAVNLFTYRAAGAVALEEGIPVSEARSMLDRDLAGSAEADCRPSGGCRPADPSNPGPYYEELFSRGVDISLEHPVGLARGTATGLFRELFGPGTDTVGRYLDVRSSTFLSAILAAFLAGFYVVLAYGLWLVAHERRGRAAGHVFALGLVAYVFVISAGHFSYARYRGPLMPILALYAGLGLATAAARLRDRFGDQDAAVVHPAAAMRG